MRRFFGSKFSNLILFIITFITTTIAGAEWRWGLPVFDLSYPQLLEGLYYSIPFLTILTFHEFGHYIAAKLYNVSVTLPYYIPFWLPISALGTLGAFIRIKSQLQSRKQFFDIGIAGPLAGFVVAIGVLFYGFTHLPDKRYIYSIHPEYETAPPDYSQINKDPNQVSMALGTNLIFIFFEKYVAESQELVPSHYEMMHYPLLFAGFFALFFTALNLIPIGQLDGGHILYGLIGYQNNRYASAALYILFVGFAGLGVVTPFNVFDEATIIFIGKTPWFLFIPLYIGLYYHLFSSITKDAKNRLLIAVSVFSAQFLIGFAFPQLSGFMGYFAFAFLLSRVLGIYHPPALYDEPLDIKRQILGWIALAIFVISFSPSPFVGG